MQPLGIVTERTKSRKLWHPADWEKKAGWGNTTEVGGGEKRALRFFLYPLQCASPAAEVHVRRAAYDVPDGHR